MSVRKSDRSEGTLQALNLSMELATYTMQICSNEKVFPKRQRWVTTQKIINECLDAASCIRRANAVFVKTDADYEYRRSQQVELLVLNDLDHFIKERLKIKCYIRYMDDFVLIHESKEYLQECRKLIENELHKIGLELNKKTSLYPLKQGVKFLRWKFRITETGKVLLLI